MDANDAGTNDNTTTRGKTKGHDSLAEGETTDSMVHGARSEHSRGAQKLPKEADLGALRNSAGWHERFAKKEWYRRGQRWCRKG
jgi:hypothetical protein